MSTDTSTTRWSYPRVLAIAITSLAVIAIALAVVGSRQPPGVGAAQIDGGFAVEHAGAQLVLRADQPVTIGAKLEVTTKPRVKATVQGRKGSLVVTFGERLSFDTDYEIRAGPVVGKDTGVRGVLRYTLHTSPAAVFTLIRSGKVDDHENDRIVELRPDGSVERTVFEDRTILEFAQAGKSSFLVSTYDHAVSKLLRIGLDGRVKETHPIRVAARRPISGLRADPETGLFGFIAVTTSDGPGRLYVGDRTHDTLSSMPVPDGDGAPMEVINWQPVPGTRGFVVLDTSSQVFMANPSRLSSGPVLLGTYGRLGGFLPSSTVLSVPDSASDGTRLLDPVHGVSRAIPGARLVDSEGQFYTLQRQLLTAGGRAVRLDTDEASQVGLDRFRVRIVQGSDIKHSVEILPGQADSVSLCLAPDGNHVAAIVQPTHQGDDRYPVRPFPLNTKTYFIDTRSGSYRIAPGSQPQWCTSGPTSSPEQS